MNRLSDIEARWAKATPGPWDTCLGSGYSVLTGVHHYPSDDGRPIFIADCLPDYMLSKKVRCEDDHRHNMRAIAAAPSDIAWLIQQVRDLREWQGRAVEVLELPLKQAKEYWAKNNGQSEGINVNCDNSSCGRCYGCRVQVLGYLIKAVDAALGGQGVGK